MSSSIGGHAQPDPLAIHALRQKQMGITDPTKSPLTPLPVLRDFSPRAKIKHPPLPALPTAAGAHAPKIPTKHVPPPRKPLPRPAQQATMAAAPLTASRLAMHAGAGLGGAAGVGGGSGSGSGVESAKMNKLEQISGLAFLGTAIKLAFSKRLDSFVKCFACFSSINSGGQGKVATALEATSKTKKELVTHMHLDGSVHIKYEPVSKLNQLRPASVDNIKGSPALEAFKKDVPLFDDALQEGNFSKALDILSKSATPKELIRAITKETLTASKNGNTLLKEALLHGSDNAVKELCMRFAEKSNVLKNVLADQIKQVPSHILQREDVRDKLEKAIGADQFHKIVGDVASAIAGRVKADEDELPPAPPVLERQHGVDRGSPAKPPVSPQAKALADAAQAKVQTRMATRAAAKPAGSVKEQLMQHPQFSKGVKSNLDALMALEGQKSGKWVFGSNEEGELVVYKKLPDNSIKEMIIRRSHDLIPFRPDSAIVVQ